MTYQDLYTIGDMFEKKLKDRKDIAGYSVDVIPDDCKVNVILVKNKPVKNTRCMVVIRNKKDTDNAK